VNLPAKKLSSAINPFNTTHMKPSQAKHHSSLIKQNGQLASEKFA
jgi:hypothetical protein